MMEWLAMSAEWLAIGLGALLLLTGFVGCVLPFLPGPLIAYGALFTLYLLGRPGCPSLTLVILTGLGTVLVTILDIALPGVGAARFKSSRLGSWGSVVGSVVGVFFLPFGLLLGPFLGALAGEFLSGKRLRPALWGALGALIGFFTGVVFKLEWCVILTLAYVYALFFQ